VRRDPAGRWCVRLSAEEEIAPLPVANTAVGTDLGLRDAVAIRPAEMVGNKRFFCQDEKRHAKAQQRRSRMRQILRHCDNARRKVSHIHAWIADQCQDFTHKRIPATIGENYVVCVVGLNLKGMVANPSLSAEHQHIGWGGTVLPGGVPSTTARPHLPAINHAARGLSPSGDSGSAAPSLAGRCEQVV